jgi:hypothetical protein
LTNKGVMGTSGRMLLQPLASPPDKRHRSSAAEMAVDLQRAQSKPGPNVLLCNGDVQWWT